MKSIINIFLGILTGFTNTAIGSCGGIVAVEGLKRSNHDQTKAHATAIAVILPLSIISAAVYIYRGNVKISDSYVYILPGLAGAFIGSKLLPKIPKKMLGKAFAVFIIYAGVRMLIK